MLSSISVVIVLRTYPIDLEMVGQLSRVLGASFSDVETVIVANGVSPEFSILLKRASEWLPDCTVLFLSEEVHDDVARLLGIDHAISDYVLFATPLKPEIEALPKMVAALNEGHDLVIGEGGGTIVERNWLKNACFELFRRVFRLLAGSTYEAAPPMFRILSRAAALYIATRNDGEVLVRARTLGQGFPATTIPVAALAPIAAPGMPFRMAVGKALRLVLTGSALPLRLSSYIGLLGGVASVAYAIYVLLIYSIKPDVEPGWTTLSLQSAGMMLLLSIQFLFLSEYLVQILSTSPVGTRRRLVARELHGTISSRSGRLNVVDREGRFQVGAPAHLCSSEEKPCPARR